MLRLGRLDYYAKETTKQSDKALGTIILSEGSSGMSVQDCAPGTARYMQEHRGVFYASRARTHSLSALPSDTAVFLTAFRPHVLRLYISSPAQGRVFNLRGSLDAVRDWLTAVRYPPPLEPAAPAA